MKVSRKIATIPTNMKGAIEWYLKLTQPLHKIRNQAIGVLVEILYSYAQTDRSLTDFDRWKQVFSYEGKIKLRETLGDMSGPTFNNQLTALRNAGALTKDPTTVTKAFNPVIEQEDDRFEVILRFELKK